MISVDTLEDNTGFAKKEQADFPILADPTKATAGKYGVLREAGALGQVANRWTFYVGPDGRIRYIEKKVVPQSAGEDMAARLIALNTPPRK